MSLTGIIIFLLVYPIFSYIKTPVKRVDIQEETRNSKGIDWAFSHYKIKDSKDFTENSISDLVIIDDGKVFEKDNLSGIDHNKLILVSLFHQFIDQPYNVDTLNESTGLNWTGYMGSTFQDLGDLNEVPQSWINEYETITPEKWAFYGEGIVIRGPQNIMVLRKGIDYDKGIVVKYNEKSIPYYGTFELLNQDGRAEASFEIDLSEESRKNFEALGISESFPAVVNLNWNLYQGYYFAGNFFDYNPGKFFQNDWIVPFMQKKIIYDTFKGEECFWKFSIPFLSRIIDEPLKKRATDQVKFEFVTKGNIIYEVDSNNKQVPFFSKGVNIGAALPGKTFTEFPKDKALYLNWFAQISDLGYNTVRIYTLLPPEFYQALYEFNAANNEPLFLLQEIWPEEHPEEGNYLADNYNSIYKKEIEMDIRAIHGDIYIPERAFRAYGAYLYDVSPYILGYLVGRELEPDEVEATDKLNIGYLYKGDFIFSEQDATPTESWLAASCDYALQVEAELYDNSPLVGIVNWPTLDTIVHDSEWNSEGDKSLQYNDKISVDINHIAIHEEKVNGFFGAYHIYPNYPDFMNNDTQYDAYQDDEGRFRYGGYLEAFMKQHKKYPAIVAEYGVSTSSVTAHFSPDGLNHGGNSEKEQSQMIARMTDAIVREDYAGAVVFEWIDEWAKKTWSTENYMIPYERHVLWHNVLDPEQNYGLVAVEAKPTTFETLYESTEIDSAIEKVEVGQNASYLTIKLTFNEPANDVNDVNGANDVNDVNDVNIGINLYDETPEYIDEFVLKLSNSPKLLVNPGYNWVKGSYRSYTSIKSSYEEMIQMVNKSNLSKEGVYTEEKVVNLSELSIGDFDSPQNSIMVTDRQLLIRLPYGLIGMSDPSSNQILWDSNKFIPTGSDQINTVRTDVVKLRIVNNLEKAIQIEYPLNAWEIPDYQFRLKNNVIN